MITRLELRDNLSTAIKKLESQYKYYKKISSILSMLNITLSSSIPIIRKKCSLAYYCFSIFSYYHTNSNN